MLPSAGPSFPSERVISVAAVLVFAALLESIGVYGTGFIAPLPPLATVVALVLSATAAIALPSSRARRPRP